MKQLIKDKVNQIIKDGGANSNTFWRIRKQVTNHNRRDDIETKDENGITITDPNEAKNHIANYYEQLYQAREGEESHKQWTQHIEREVEKIALSQDKSRNENPFEIEELNRCIQSLKRNKSTGPDKMPNEIFIEANSNTRKIYLQALNKVYDHEEIPAQWQQGEIIRIYKGKGTKAKCSSERGITLASNVGKVFERLVNNCIKNEIITTEAQSGGEQGKATADHITILNGVINHHKKCKTQSSI